MYRVGFRVLVLPVLFAGMVGCNSAPSMPFDRGQANLKTVGYVTPAVPDSPSVWQAATVGQSFGLVGALVDASIQEVREGKFEKIVAAQAFDAKSAFKQEIGKAVESQGFEVHPLSVERKGADYLKTYPAAAGGEQAYLDVLLLGYGYVAAGMGSPWRPFAEVKLKLVRVADGKVLMEHQIEYAPTRPLEGAITIAADPEYAFADIDAMQAQPEKTMKGMEIAFSQVAASVGKLLQ